MKSKSTFILRMVLLGVILLVIITVVSVQQRGVLPAFAASTQPAIPILNNGARPNDVLATYNLPRDQTLIRLGGESRLLYSGLVRFNPKMVLTPDLAESWDIDASRTIFTFHLRHNVTFQNGRAFTAEDVRYSWERAADPVLHSDTVLTYLGLMLDRES